MSLYDLVAAQEKRSFDMVQGALFYYPRSKAPNTFDKETTITKFNKYSLQGIRNKPFAQMNQAEKDYYQMEVETFVRNLKAKHPDEAQFLLGVGKMLRDEAAKDYFSAAQEKRSFDKSQGANPSEDNSAAKDSRSFNPLFAEGDE